MRGVGKYTSNDGLRFEDYSANGELELIVLFEFEGQDVYRISGSSPEGKVIFSYRYKRSE